MKENEIDEATKADIARARNLVKRAADIVWRTKVSARALELLGNVDFHLSHPQPVLWRELASLCTKRTKEGHPILDSDSMPYGFDWAHIYLTLEDAMELGELSRTTIRKLVNDEYMTQPYRGLYQVQGFLRAVQDFYDPRFRDASYRE